MTRLVLVLLTLAAPLVPDGGLSGLVAPPPPADDSTTQADQLRTEPGRANRPVTVETTSGHRYRGSIDPQTDSDCLWLRSQRPGILVRRPVAWELVATVQLAGDARESLVLAGAQAREIVARIREEVPVPPRDRPRATESPVDAGARAEYHSSASSSTAASRGTPCEPARVAWLEIDARLGLWDGDVSADGILVEVAPRDLDGYPVAAAGTLDLQLFGIQPGPNGGPEARLRRLGSWSRRLRVEDYRHGVARVMLPFQGVHPQSATNLFVQGAAHARLSVPGQGAFETTQEMVRLRPYSVLRDWLELSTGRRVLPGEWIDARGQAY
ncbi:MAG: hypothetical protein ACOY3P_17590 [Planctomycetota bacterium]